MKEGGSQALQDGKYPLAFAMYGEAFKVTVKDNDSILLILTYCLTTDSTFIK